MCFYCLFWCFYCVPGYFLYDFHNDNNRLCVRVWFWTVPGPPSSVYFPEVTTGSVHIEWSEPREPNGVITGYRVTYGLHTSMMQSDDSVSASLRHYRVTGLSPYQQYLFTVAAKTQSGWGSEASVVVYTTFYRSESVHLFIYLFIWKLEILNLQNILW